MGSSPSCGFKGFCPPIVLKVLIAGILMGSFRLSRPLLDTKLENQLDAPLFLSF